jgi:hypothetical protein
MVLSQASPQQHPAEAANRRRFRSLASVLEDIRRDPQQKIHHDREHQSFQWSELEKPGTLHMRCLADRSPLFVTEEPK